MATPEYDTIIRGSRVVDGMGRPPFAADVAITDGRIVAIGEVKGDSRTEIDGTGLVASPGFIDPHTHADSAILRHPLAANFVMQGVTTIIAGHCGVSMAPIRHDCSAAMVNAWEWWQDARSGQDSYPAVLPMDEYSDVIKEKVGFPVDWRTFGEFLDRVASTGIAVNFASYVGHDTLRIAVMGGDFKRHAESAEIEDMIGLLVEAMESGAFGLSSMTDPGPGEYASADEFVQLTGVVREHGGCYSPHTRHTQSQWPSSDMTETGYGVYHGPVEDVWVGRYRGLLEAIEVARRSGVKLHVAHLSNVFRIPQPHPDYLEEAMALATLDIVDDAISRGIDITFDVVASADCIATGVLLRDEFEEWIGGATGDELTQRLRSTRFREDVWEAYRRNRLKFQMIHTMADPYWMNSFRVLRCRDRQYEGHVVGDLAAEVARPPLDLLIDMLAQDPDTVWVQFRDERGTETANATFLSHRLAMPCSDAEVHGQDPPCDLRSAPPPTAYGMFPHYIRLTVNERRAMSLEEAVRKATALVAQRLGVRDRGTIKEGYFADIVLFDKDSIRDMGNFLQPTIPPEGIDVVMVNGKIVYRKNGFTSERPGMALRL